MRHARTPARTRTRGAALLAALLTVTLVATLAASALWQQWRSVAVESAERTRLQATWILAGALDWARLILLEDGRGSNVDHLAEPWAMPLQEARLSTFLAAQEGSTTVSDASVDTTDAFLSGHISDLQARLNLRNLLGDKTQQQLALRQFTRLFDRLGLPPQELALLHSALQKAHNASDADAPLLPATVEQLGWLGLAPASVARLAPHATLLPVPTAVNANTASAEVLWAAIDNLDPAGAEKLVQARAQRFFRSVEDVRQALGAHWDFKNTSPVTVNSQFFEVRGTLRLNDLSVQERSLVQRQPSRVFVLWRQRDSLPPLPPGSAPP